MLSLMAVTQAYAQGDINVTFFRDYGDEEGATEQYFESGVEKVLRTNTFTRAGYHFLNWSDDGGVTYSDGQLVTFINDMGDGSTVSVILYAQWGKNRYTVTFAGEGVNEATFPEIKLEALNTGTVPATVPTRTGYVFKGWSGSDGKSYQPGDLLKNPNDYSDGSLTLTAQWAAEIAVKFDINGADGTVPEHIKGEANGSISLPKADGLSLTGHTFAGWKTAGDETLYASGATFTLPSASTPTEITFTAQWTPNKYKVKFDRNGSLLGKDMSDQNFIYGKQQRLSPNQYDKLAHDFGGWNTDKDGKGTAYTDNQEVLNLTDQNGATVTLYAQWKYRSYTIKYDPNGALGSIADMTVAKDEEVALSDGTGYTRKGYTLSNWNMAADGTGTSYTPGQTVKNINGKNDVVTLYAQWTPNKYTIVFDPNPKEGDEDKISGGPMGTLNMTYDEEDRYLPENIFKYEAIHSTSGTSNP